MTKIIGEFFSNYGSTGVFYCTRFTKFVSFMKFPVEMVKIVSHSYVCTRPTSFIRLHVSQINFQNVVYYAHYNIFIVVLYKPSFS